MTAPTGESITKAGELVVTSPLYEIQKAGELVVTSPVYEIRKAGELIVYQAPVANQLKVSKETGYAVLKPHGLSVSRTRAYAVLSPGNPKLQVAKTTGYGVLKPQGLSVSRPRGYAVILPETPRLRVSKTAGYGVIKPIGLSLSRIRGYAAIVSKELKVARSRAFSAVQDPVMTLSFATYAEVGATIPWTGTAQYQPTAIQYRVNGGAWTDASMDYSDTSGVLSGNFPAQAEPGFYEYQIRDKNNITLMSPVVQEIVISSDSTALFDPDNMNGYSQESDLLAGGWLETFGSNKGYNWKPFGMGAEPNQVAFYGYLAKNFIGNVTANSGFIVFSVNHQATPLIYKEGELVAYLNFGYQASDIAYQSGTAPQFQIQFDSINPASLYGGGAGGASDPLSLFHFSGGTILVYWVSSTPNDDAGLNNDGAIQIVDSGGYILLTRYGLQVPAIGALGMGTGFGGSYADPPGPAFYNLLVTNVAAFHAPSFIGPGGQPNISCG